MKNFFILLLVVNCNYCNESSPTDTALSNVTSDHKQIEESKLVITDEDIMLRKDFVKNDLGLRKEWKGVAKYLKSDTEANSYVEVFIDLCNFPYSETLVFLTEPKLNRKRNFITLNITDQDYQIPTFWVNFYIPGDFSFSDDFIVELSFDAKTKKLSFLGNEYFSPIEFKDYRCRFND
ncbi:hypothetical protein EHQ59_03795 [Leptospira kemamanensis]|uniref:Uncharacterized protein n=1 Tax=Leptospira kemamanensis TaxID=2484942 RepID=A0A4R9JUC8_9LEPT|nr:hypothetical protein [Leptospira kemamanensis]TGL55543.1 hypothetical protein EHQ59_03795 [Leptospira kemamanensis]